MAKAKAEEEALIASEKAQKAANATNKLEEEVKKLSKKEAEAANLAKEAEPKAEAAGSTLDNLLTKAKDFSAGGGFSWEKLSSQITTSASQQSDKEPTTQVATIRGRAKARSLLPQRAILKQQATKPKPKKPEEEPELKPELRNVFGGLFKQETIYVDDD